MRTLLRHKREVHVDLITVVFSIRTWYCNFLSVNVWNCELFFFIYASVSVTVSLNYSNQ